MNVLRIIERDRIAAVFTVVPVEGVTAVFTIEEVVALRCFRIQGAACAMDGPQAHGAIFIASFLPTCIGSVYNF